MYLLHFPLQCNFILFCNLKSIEHKKYKSIWEVLWEQSFIYCTYKMKSNTKDTEKQGCKFWQSPVTLKQDQNLLTVHSLFNSSIQKPARDKYICSTKCHLWHISRGSKCLGCSFWNKLLTAADDETEHIQNYSRTSQNLLNLLQPGARPSPSPRETDNKNRPKKVQERKNEKDCRLIQKC